MIEELVRETIEILETEFYSKRFDFSYSSISTLLFSPAVFYQVYVLGHRPEKKGKNLIEGSVIHCLLLEEHTFKDKYIVSPTNIPKDPSKSVIDTVFFKNRRSIYQDPDITLDTLEYSILDTLTAVNLHQTLKLDSARLEKIITPQNESYFEFLKNKEGKELLDQETYDYCVSAVEVIKMTPGVSKLLGLDVKPSDNIDVFNELYLEASIPSETFGIKGFLDNLVINHDEKVIYINDFKTSGKALDKFEEAIEFWNYWLQAAMYINLVSLNYPDLVKKGYGVKFCFLVIDKYFNVYPFHLTEKTALHWQSRFMDTLKEVKYHYYNHKYELPMKFDLGLVRL